MLLLAILSLFALWSGSNAIQLSEGSTQIWYYYRHVKPFPNITRARANFSCFDIRVGKIVDLQNHSTEATLYIMKVDFGSSMPHKTVVDTIRPYILAKDLLNQLCLFMLNWVPYAFGGIDSEAMILVACEGRIMETLHPPNGSVPGDIVYVPGYEHKPVRVLSQENFTDAFYYLHTDSIKRVCYNHTPVNVSGKGYAKVYDIFEPCQIR